MRKVEIDLPPFPAIVNPKHILEIGAVRPAEGCPPIITDITDPNCALQQNGIDLRLDDAALAAGCTNFFVDKKRDRRCDYHQVFINSDNTFNFQPGKQYSLDFMEWIEVPENMAAYLFLRSSVNRFSGTVFTGLWDAGFKGRLGGIFRPSVLTNVERGFRMAQVVFFYSDSYRTYEGQYQNQQHHVGIVKEKEHGRREGTASARGAEDSF